MNNKITHRQLEEAIEFFNYNINEGIYDEDIIANLTDEEIVLLYKNESLRGEYMEELDTDQDYQEYLADNMAEAEATGN